MIEYRDAGGRFLTRDAGRSTRHSFSFGAHYDPGNVGFAQLVALNDEQLPPGTGYPDHPHENLEIVSWVLTGALRHTSTVGSAELGPGQVQRLSAGSGVVHAEACAGVGTTRFLQAWVRPDEAGLDPSYVSADPGADPRDGSGWTCVADGSGGGLVPLASAGTSLHLGRLEPGGRLDLPDAPRLHVMVVAGRVLLGERTLSDGDAARLRDEGGRSVTGEDEARLLVWAFRGSAHRG